MPLNSLSTGTIYRNPKPHLHSRHAYFPWVTTLPSGDLLASFQLCSAFEAADGHCELARSTDLSETWTQEGRIYPGTGQSPPTSDCLKTTCDREAGVVIAFGTRFDRSDPEAAIANEATGGLLPMEVIQLFSHDEGRTWSEPQIVATPIPGPFEAQAPVVVLADGSWIVPMSTWADWDGNHPNGDKCISLISRDKGRTWGEMATMLEDPEGKLIFWEVRIAELEPGRLIALGWTHDKTIAKDRENQFTTSDDGGLTWAPFKSAGIPGQSLCPVHLGGGKLLVTYNHRYGQPGVRARLMHLDSGDLVTDEETVIWGVGMHREADIPVRHAVPASDRLSDSLMVTEMSSFKFGQPSPHLLADGTILATHWCVQDCVGEIRWTRVAVL